MDKFIVRFRRPDGTTDTLRTSDGSGDTASWPTREAAGPYADERNTVWGRHGWRYEVVPIESGAG